MAMLEHLMRIIQRLRSSPPRLPPFAPPDAPDAGVRHPKLRGGPGGVLAAAVDEPEPAPVVEAISRR
jgi:hypothetical protein